MTDTGAKTSSDDDGERKMPRHSLPKMKPILRVLHQSLALALVTAVEVARAAEATKSSSSPPMTSRRPLGNDQHRGMGVTNNSLLGVGDGSGGGGDDDDGSLWREIKAILGGVLGFWGGVGGLGALFLVVVLSQRYCCRKGDEEKDGDGVG